jgi:hypothetical protein
MNERTIFLTVVTAVIGSGFLVVDLLWAEPYDWTQRRFQDVTIEGTVISIDAVHSQIVVKEDQSGIQKPIFAASPEDLDTLEQGDQVMVRLESGSANRADTIVERPGALGVADTGF